MWRTGFAPCWRGTTLAHLRLIDAPQPPPAGDVEALRLFEVVDTEHAGDRFDRA